MRVFFRRGKQPLDLRPQLWRNDLIRIQTQNPALGRLLRGGIFLGDMAPFHVSRKTFRAERFGDFVRAIVHVMVEDDVMIARPIRHAFSKWA